MSAAAPRAAARPKAPTPPNGPLASPSAVFALMASTICSDDGEAADPIRRKVDEHELSPKAGVFSYARPNGGLAEAGSALALDSVVVAHS